MSPGPQTRALNPDQIHRLEKFRMAAHEGAPHGYSLPLLRTAIGAQFGWRTLKKALQGRPVSVLHHAYIVQWIERFLSVPSDGRSVMDSKSRAAGEKDESDEETSEATRTVRGSR